MVRKCPILTDLYKIRYFFEMDINLLFLYLQEIPCLLKQQKMELKGNLHTQWKPLMAFDLTWTS